MTQHYTRNTVSASAWCKKCRKKTQHRIDGVNLGPCLECIEKAEARAQAQKQKPASRPAVQEGFKF